MRYLTTLTLGTMFLTLPLAAQTYPLPAASALSNSSGPLIAVRQATPEEVGYINVPSPMLLDISLGAHGYTQSLKDMSLKDVWSAGGTEAYVCDNARFDWVQVTKDHYPGRYELTVRPLIESEVPGLTIGVTVAIISNGQELQRQTWNVDTRGLTPGEVLQAPSGSGTEFHFQFTEEEFADLFDRGQAPLLRIIMDVR